MSHWGNSRPCSVRRNSPFKSFKSRDAPFCALCTIHPYPRVPPFILDDGLRKVQQIFEKLSAKQPASRGLSNVRVCYFIFLLAVSYMHIYIIITPQVSYGITGISPSIYLTCKYRMNPGVQFTHGSMLLIYVSCVSLYRAIQIFLTSKKVKHRFKF